MKECQHRSISRHAEAEFPDGGCVWINVAPTAQAERYINAYQKKNNASGYYLMNMKANTKISRNDTRFQVLAKH